MLLNYVYIENHGEKDLIITLNYEKIKDFLIESEDSLWTLHTNLRLFSREKSEFYDDGCIDIKELIESQVQDSIVLHDKNGILLSKFLANVGLLINPMSTRNYTEKVLYDKTFPNLYVTAGCNSTTCKDTALYFLTKEDFPIISILELE